MGDTVGDTSLPGTYGPDDPGGGLYDPETGVRDWYYENPGVRFGQWMRDRRRMLGLTVTQVADEMTAAGSKIDFSAVAKLEKGQRKVTLDEAVLISRLLGVDIGYMTSLERPADLQQWLIDEDHKRLGRRRGKGSGNDET
ncbi:helix-turn-helix domain-containing protein [Prescottella agglutinans]|uniref:Transcriptional regulator with XRE-family HTH domain n=1 Tax=Prescottella agglutinans TaxID=1644129 RepID=A0ABT6MG28_9NOCA|nr:helix-turn-helix transcriptional regulator [Prescottella agglutinans]MDH6283278.1 transcriptional regulator with XRE-family HTH domain [Prescottella agglutinans]